VISYKNKTKYEELISITHFIFSSME